MACRTRAYFHDMVTGRWPQSLVAGRDDRLVMLVHVVGHLGTIIAAGAAQLFGQLFRRHDLPRWGLNRRNRLALLTTVTELSDMAAPAITGLSRLPVIG